MHSHLLSPWPAGWREVYLWACTHLQNQLHPDDPHHFLLPKGWTMKETTITDHKKQDRGENIFKSSEQQLCWSHCDYGALRDQTGRQSRNEKRGSRVTSSSFFGIKHHMGQVWCKMLLVTGSNHLRGLMVMDSPDCRLHGLGEPPASPW